MGALKSARFWCFSHAPTLLRVKWRFTPGKVRVPTVETFTKDTVSLYDTYCFVLQKIVFYPRSDSLLGSFRYHLRLVRISLYPPKGLSPYLVDDIRTSVRRYSDDP